MPVVSVKLREFNNEVIMKFCEHQITDRYVWIIRIKRDNENL